LTNTTLSVVIYNYGTGQNSAWPGNWAQTGNYAIYAGFWPTNVHFPSSATDTYQITSGDFSSVSQTDTFDQVLGYNPILGNYIQQNVEWTAGNPTPSGWGFRVQNGTTTATQIIGNGLMADGNYAYPIESSDRNGNALFVCSSQTATAGSFGGCGINTNPASTRALSVEAGLNGAASGMAVYSAAALANGADMFAIYGNQSGQKEMFAFTDNGSGVLLEKHLYGIVANYYNTSTVQKMSINSGTGAIAPSLLDQNATNNIGGSCAMSTSTSCTITLATAYTTALCIATQQSATLTGGAVGCTVSGTTVTITSAVANSETWAALIFGNPN
jgi:hypothetical protein